MHNEIERKFVIDYIIKEKQERFVFELGSPKKRETAISRFSHNVENILKKGVNKQVVTNFADIHETDQSVYVISAGNKDGTIMSLFDAFSYAENAYAPVIIVGKCFSIIKEEVEGGNTRIFYLK